MWTPLVGTVCLQAAYVLPAVVAGGGLATAAWFAVGKESRTALAAAAGVLAAGSAAWGAATPGMSQVGGVVAAVAVVVAFLGFSFERPVPPHLVLAVSLVGLAGGCLVFLVATWAIAPQWATDACLRQAGEALDALERMVRADGGGRWRFDDDDDDDDEEEEDREEEQGAKEEEQEEEAEDASSPSTTTTFLGASGEPSRPRIPPMLKRLLFQKRGSSGRRRRAAEAAAAAEAKGATAAAAANTDEEALPPPLKAPTTPTVKKATTAHHHRIPPPGYNRPAPLAGGDTLPAASRAWVQLSASLDAAEALLKPAAGEAFWGLFSVPRWRISSFDPFSSSSSAGQQRQKRLRFCRLRVLTPALPPPLWPLRLRECTNSHVVALRARVEELSAALRASARLCWTMRSLSQGPSPQGPPPLSLSLTPGGPVMEVAKEVYLVDWEEEEGEEGEEEGDRKRRGRKQRNLLSEWQAALEAAAAAAARAVPRSFSPLQRPSSSGSEEEEDDEDPGEALSAALAALRRAADALALARERAATGKGGGGGNTPWAVALLLSRAAEDEKGDSFAEEARFGAWEGGVVQAVASAERVGRAVEALRGMMPK